MEDVAALRTARWWRRAFGAIPDAAILVGCCEVARIAPNEAVVVALAVVLVAAYLIGPQCYRGQSLGKWIAGTRVVALNGSPIPLVRSTVRAIAQVTSTLGLLAAVLWGTSLLLRSAQPTSHDGGDDIGSVLLAGLVNFIAMTLTVVVVIIAVPLSNGRRRGIHDLIAGTWVVEAFGTGAAVPPRPAPSRPVFRPW